MSVTLRALWIIARRAVRAAVTVVLCAIPRILFAPFLIARAATEDSTKSTGYVFLLAWFVTMSGIGLAANDVAARPKVVCGIILAQLITGVALRPAGGAILRKWTAAVQQAEAEISQKQANPPDRETLLRPSQGEQAEALLRVVNGGTAFDRCDFGKGEL